MPMTTLSKVPNLGFGFANIVGPLISGGIILSALFYSKSIRIGLGIEQKSYSSWKEGYSG
jgi:hypothetical protein